MIRESNFRPRPKGSQSFEKIDREAGLNVKPTHQSFLASLDNVGPAASEYSLIDSFQSDGVHDNGGRVKVSDPAAITPPDTGIVRTLITEPNAGLGSAPTEPEIPRMVVSTYEEGVLQSQFDQNPYTGTLTVLLNPASENDTTAIQSLTVERGLMKDDGFQKSAQRTMGSYPIKDLLASDDEKLAKCGADLKQRYGDIEGLKVLDVGPNCYPFVARALHNPGKSTSYLGVDVSEAGTEKLNQAIEHLGGDLAKSSKAVQGDLFALPVKDETQDVVTAFAMFPVSAPTEDAVDAFQEVNRVLKPGGEFYVHGFGLSRAAPATVAYVLENWEIVGTPKSTSEGFILRKPPLQN